MEKKYAGDDIEIQFTVKDNGTVVDLSGYTGIICVFYYPNGDVLGRYSLNTVTGYNSDDLEVVVAANGTFKVRIQSDVTRAASKFGEIRAEIKVEASNADYTDSTYHTLVRDVRCFQLFDSKSKNVSSF